MTAKAARNTLLILMAILGLGALGGGAVLIISPTGELIGIPLSMLEHSPFHSFLIPGVILLMVLGLAPCLVIFALLKRPDSTFAEKFNVYYDMQWAWTYCIYTAFALIIWIQVEMIYLQSVNWLHTLYMLLAIVILFVSLLPKVRNEYKIEPTKI